MTILYHEFGDTKNVGKTTFFFAIFLHIILPFTIYKFYQKSIYRQLFYVDLWESEWNIWSDWLVCIMQRQLFDE